jgi:hypothetical protein
MMPAPQVATLRLLRSSPKKCAWIIGALFCLFLGGCQKNTTPIPEQVQPQNQDNTKDAEAANKPPDVSLTADEWRAEKAKSEKYTGKTIQLSGTVDYVGRTLSGQSYISLALAAEDAFSGVDCSTIDKEPWAEVAKGQTVTLKGVYSEIGMVRCVIVKKGPATAITLSAEQLAAEFGTDPEKVNKKYDGKTLILTGEVVPKKDNKGGTASVYLKGTDKVPVECVFTAYDKDMTAKLKEGQQVKLCGHFWSSEGGADPFKLQFCQTITK